MYLRALGGWKPQSRLCLLDPHSPTLSLQTGDSSPVRLKRSWTVSQPIFAAAVFYAVPLVRVAYFAWHCAQEQPPDHYRLLGLGRLELNADAIVYAAERQSDQLKRFTSGEHGETAIALLAAVSSARDCLLDHDLHRVYAGRLQGFDPDSNDLDTKSAWRSFAEEFDEAWSRSQTLEFDAQHYWLGIPRHQRPASNCRLLGISEGEQNADVVQSAAERQISFVRKFASGDKATEANTLLQQLSRARSTLLRIASVSPPDHASDPGDTDLLDEHVEILPPEPEVELFDEVPASDPRWVSANTIDDPLANVSTPPPQTSVIDDSQPLVVRPRSQKGRARFTIRAMVFALLILSSHSLIGYFGYQLLLAEPESEPTSEIVRFEPQRGAGMREPTERGRAQSAQTLPRLRRPRRPVGSPPMCSRRQPEKRSLQRRLRSPMTRTRRRSILSNSIAPKHWPIRSANKLWSARFALGWRDGKSLARGTTRNHSFHS